MKTHRLLTASLVPAGVLAGHGAADVALEAAFGLPLTAMVSDLSLVAAFVAAVMAVFTSALAGTSGSRVSFRLLAGVQIGVYATAGLAGTSGGLTVLSAAHDPVVWVGAGGQLLAAAVLSLLCTGARLLGDRLRTPVWNPRSVGAPVRVEPVATSSDRRRPLGVRILAAMSWRGPPSAGRGFPA